MPPSNSVMGRQQNLDIPAGCARAPARAAVPTPLRDQLTDLYRSRDWEQALYLGEDMARDYPGDAFAWKALASVLLESGQWLRSLDALEQALSLDPRDPETHLFLAEALYCLDRPTRAQTHLETALALEPGGERGFAILDSQRNLEQVLRQLADAEQRRQSSDPGPRRIIARQLQY